MNVFVQARLSESYFEQVMGDSGYKRLTTFSSDLTIAEVMEGANGIETTFKRVVKEWKDDVKYFTEFVMALNIKSWECFNMEKTELSELYSDLYYKAQEIALDNFKGKDLLYYYKVTD